MLLVLTIWLAIWIVSSREPPRTITSTWRPSQITISPALDVYPAFYPALSPDGTTLAYSSDRGGGFEIFVKQLAPGGDEVQLTRDGHQNLQPAWSPDGTHIAYYSNTRGGIWVVPAFGGVARQLTDFGSLPAWSPEGEEIAFQSYPLMEIGLESPPAMPTSTIWVCRWNSSDAPRQITKPGQPSGGHGAASWSPDGDRIAFTSSGYGIYSAWSVGKEGGAPEMMVQANIDYFEIFYTPSGEDFYFTGRQEGVYGLWRASVHSPATTLTLVATALPAAIRHPTLSGDGKRLAYSALTMRNDLRSVRLDPVSSGAVDGSTPLTADTAERHCCPAFSPDGQQIAFNHMLQSGHSGAWLMSADGKNPKPLTSRGGYFNPHWLPGGDRIVVSDTRNDTFVLTLATRRVEPLHAGGSDWERPTLSHDGGTIAFHADRDGRPNIWSVPVGGGRERQVTFERDGASFPSWSRDGSYLAFQIHEGNNRHIAVVPLDGGEPIQLTNDPGQSWTAGQVWSPDNDKIAYVKLREDVWNVWWVARSDRTQKQLTDYDTSHHYVRYPAWSPSGDQIVYEYSAVASDIWLVELP